MTQVNFYDKDQTDALLDTKAKASDVTALETSVGKDTDTASASGSLWARIKYVLAHWLTADTEQTVSAKKTFSVSPEVPTTPATPASAVNSVYVNDATEGVNNIGHKTGTEKFPGTKIFDAPAVHMNYADRDDVSTTYNYVDIPIIDNAGQQIMFFRALIDTNNRRRLYIVIWNPTTQSAVWNLLAEVEP